VQNRWLAFAAILFGCVLVLLTQPPQTAFLFMAGIVLVSLALSVALSVSEGRSGSAVRAQGESLSLGTQISTFFERMNRLITQVHWQQGIALVASLALMYIGQFQIYQDPNDRPISGGWAFILVGLAMFYATLKRQYPPIDGAVTVQPAADDAHRLKIRWVWLVIAFGLLAWVSYRSILKPQEAYLWEHLILWILAMVALVMAFAPAEGEARRPNTHPMRWYEYGIVIALFVAGMVIRGTNLGGNPDVLDQDEAIFAREGASFVLEKFLITPFEPGFHSHPRMYQAMIGVSNALLGFTLEAARMPSAIMGALGVAALFLLGRELFGWRISLAATLFMLPWFFHVQLARLSMNQPGDPLFATLSFYFLLRGLRRAAPTDYVLSGCMLACAQLFYLGGRLVIPVMIAYLIFLYIAERPLIRRQWRYLMIIPISAFLIALPQNHYLFYFHEPISTRAEPNILLGGQLQRIADNGESVTDYLVTQFRHSFLALFQIPDQSGWIGRGSNMLGVWGAPLLLIGVLLSLIVIWRRPRWSLPLGWTFSVILVGSTLSISPPQYQRYYPAVSAMSLLVIMGAMAAAYGLAKIVGRPGAYKNIVLGIGVLLFLGNAWFYYGVYIPESPFLRNRPNWATNATAREMVAAATSGRQIILINQFATGVESTLVVQYFMMGRSYNILDDGLFNFNAAQPFTVIAAPERKEDLDKFVERYPGGRVRQVYLGQDGSLGLYVYERG